MPIGFYFDQWYVLLTVPALIFSLWAQWRVTSTFRRFSRVGVRSGMTGAEAAAAVMRAAGVHGVTIDRHKGFLSDHYDPRSRTLRLSPEVHDGRSVSSIAVAAHEAGHALQDQAGYTPLVLRSQLVPVTNIGSRLWWLPFVLGLVLAGTGSQLGITFMYAGIVMFAAVVFFQLVTLPTEFNASNRAKALLATSGIVSTQEEAQGVSRVLGAAALTYVAAAAAAILQLVYLVIRTQQASRN